MPTKRTILNRPRRVAFDNEILDLFQELERAPHDRYGDFKRSPRNEEVDRKSRRLAKLLDLTDEWWQMQHVSDWSREPCHPEHCCAFHSWHKCREVRLRLLEALKDRARIRMGTEASPE